MALGLSAHEQMKLAGESSLYYFARVILGLRFLTPHFHQSLAQFLQNPVRYRKLALAPRDHAKTMLIKAQILHALIQPKYNNIYFPGIAGNELRIVLAGESLENVSRHLRVIRVYIERNKLLRTLWPHVVPGDKWTDHQIVVQRQTNYSEPTVEAVGIETALASRHIDWLFEDDIFTYKAMLSSTIANRTITWHQAAEGVLDEHENSTSRETVTGTPWAQNDVYRHIIEQESEESPDLQDDDELRNDPSLFCIFKRSAIEHDQPLWPERFSLQRLRRIERRYKGTGLFELNFLCDYEASILNEFNRKWLRYFDVKDDMLVIPDDTTHPYNVMIDQLEEDMNKPYQSPVAMAIQELMKQTGHDVDDMDISRSYTASQEHKSMGIRDVENWLRGVLK